MKKGAPASLMTAVAVIAIVLALGVVYVGYQASSLRSEVDRLENELDSVIAPLEAQISLSRSLADGFENEVWSATSILSDQIDLLENMINELEDELGPAIIPMRDQIILLENSVSKLESEFGSTMIGLRTQTSELERLVQAAMLTAEVIIYYEPNNYRSEKVSLTPGATALDALRKVAVVETTYYFGLGEFIDSIDGVQNDPTAYKYWMWYIWSEDEAAWKLAPVSVGNYDLRDGDKIKFNYEIPSW